MAREGSSAFLEVQQAAIYFSLARIRAVDRSYALPEGWLPGVTVTVHVIPAASTISSGTWSI